MTKKYGQWAGNEKGTPENETRCIENVSDGYRTMTFHQCYRQRGFGKNGLYCKQHAKRHPDTNLKGKTAYVAFYKYYPALAQITIVSETKKCATVSRVRDIIGDAYIGTTLNKDYYELFETEVEARVYLRKLIKSKINALRDKIMDLEIELKQI